MASLACQTRVDEDYWTGYTRVILAGLSLHFMSYHPKYCTLLYGISCLLDAVDGQAARALGQTSKFGAVLDMVTDRCVFLPSCHRWDGQMAHRCQAFIVYRPADARPHVCYVTYPPHTRVMQSSSSSSSPWTSPAITCTCTGVLYAVLCPLHLMPHDDSSLLTGSRSHKLVTSDVSRILWYYYNDSVRTPSHGLPIVSAHRGMHPANAFFHVRRKRALLCLALPHEVDPNTHCCGVALPWPGRARAQCTAGIHVA